ncbi:MAG: hypothetical protein P8K81_02360, partial [Flavobacteriales bacterium]|nr:hypothetical protein [Flavobacteriales bacterium]
MAFALVLVLGIFMGYQQRGEEGSSSGFSTNRGRVVHILDRIEQLYVDPVMREDLEAAAVEA